MYVGTCEIIPRIRQEVQQERGLHGGERGGESQADAWPGKGKKVLVRPLTQNSTQVERKRNTANRWGEKS